MIHQNATRGLLLAAAAIVLAVAASSSARAADDGEAPLWSAIGGMLGLTDTDKFEESIKYA